MTNKRKTELLYNYFGGKIEVPRIYKYKSQKGVILFWENNNKEKTKGPKCVLKVNEKQSSGFSLLKSNKVREEILK